MHVRCSIAALLLTATALAQSSPSPCPADKPVDELIAELNQQTKKSQRNKNPLPDTICIFGWCRATSKKPPVKPEPVPREEAPSASGNVSSSKNAAASCDVAMEMALDAAHNVDVGDYYFAQKNYRGAALRYEDALSEKAGDAAIYVRRGRVLEKLNDSTRALEQYQAAVKLAGPEKWMLEARAAVARLEKSQSQ